MKTESKPQAISEESKFAANSFINMVTTGEHEMFEEFINTEEGQEMLALPHVHPLSHAARFGDLRMVEILVEAGADLHQSGLESYVHGKPSINNGTHFLKPPIAEAVQAESENHDDIFRYLLKAGANPNDALNEVAEIRRLDLMKELIDHGADLKTHGEQALEQVFNWENGPNEDAKYDMAKLILDQGPVWTDGGSTALSRVVDVMDLDCLNLLLERGADVNAHQGWMIYTAGFKRWDEGLDCLVKHGADLVDGLRWATEIDDIAVAERFLNKGVAPSREMVECARDDMKDLLMVHYEHHLLKRHLAEHRPSENPTQQQSHRRRI